MISRQATPLLLAVLLGACASPDAPVLPNAPAGAASANEGARSSARVHTELAAAYYERGQFGISLEELRKAQAADSRYAPAHNMLGVLYMELNDHAAAENAFKQAIAVDPTDAETRNNYGWFLCKRKRYDESFEQFAAALRNPLYATPEKALANAGGCARESGKLAEARDYYARALRINPRLAHVTLALAETSFQEGRVDEAKRWLDRIEHVEPTPQSLWLGVRIARRQGDRDLEASLGAKLRKRFPDAPETEWLLSGREN
jgi:type IV pilus assembly protein PilF